MTEQALNVNVTVIFLLGFYTMRYFLYQEKLFSNAHGLFLNPEMSLPFELLK